MANAADSPSIRAHITGRVAGVLAAAGSDTTHATANTENLITHGVVDPNGSAVPAANLAVLAIPTSNEASVYVGTAISATQFDIRSTGTAVPYNWYVFIIN